MMHATPRAARPSGVRASLFWLAADACLEL